MELHPIGGLDPALRLALPLQAGQTYIVLTTSFGADVTGTYDWTVLSDGNGLIDTTPGDPQITPAPTTQMVNFDLICDDIDYVLLDNLPLDIPRCYRTDRDGNVIFPPNFIERQKIEALLDWLSTTGYPNADDITAKGGEVTDNCGYLEICVSDETSQSGDCGDVILTRTFEVKDKQGNYINPSPCDGEPQTDVCTQTITFRNVVFQDVVVPPFTVFLECDEEFPVDDNGNPHPSLTGGPTDDFCWNIGGTYEDLEIPILSVDLDTLTTVEIIEKSFQQVRLQEPIKVQCIQLLMENHFDVARLMAELNLSSPAVTA